ncbi:putative DNA-directed RNA polymerase subunit [Trypanosoma cruzi]|uniref:Putative DNA-directed RNA polymerase subunit n=1 Tax=Trypanosoma cruzi TaxID=5693 RepID=A0A2V2WUY6_TRYCR|nr:putative DNA-directed RNA polymerase subunit [Trypanosoma cruzi]
MERVGRPKTSYKQCAEQGSRTVQVGYACSTSPRSRCCCCCCFCSCWPDPSAFRFLVDALQRPVKHVVHVVPLPNEELSEEPFQVAVVRLVLEAQASGVVEVRGKLRGKPLHSVSTGVVCLRSDMREYFSCFVCAFRPCHGSEPRKKYIRM